LSAVRKFAFDTVFAPDGAILRDGKGFRTQYNTEEVEAVKASAFEEGRQIETVRAEQSAADAANRLAQAANAILARLDHECATLREEAAALALAAARKAVGAALDEFGEERIVAAVEETMELLRHGPRLTIRVPTNSYNTLRPRLEALAQQSAYAGAIMVREDAGLASADVTLEWAEGLIAFDREDLFSRIEEIMTRSLQSARAAEESAP
jgi:flagellar assembly protein FliH